MDNLEERKKLRDFESADIEGVTIEFVDKNEPVKKSFSDTIHDLLKTFQNKDE